MHIKQILFFFVFTTTLQSIDEKTARDIAIEESRRTMESFVWAQRTVSSGNGGVHNHIHNTAHSSSNSNPTSSATIIEPKIETTKKDPYTEKNSHFLFLKNLDIQKFLIHNKTYIAGGVVLACYIYTFNRIYQINKLLNNSSSWHLFKEEIPLTRLSSINKKELFKELQLAICKKYLNAADCDNDQKIMLKFLADITHEKSTLETYITYQSVINRCYLSKIFPTFKKIEHVQESVARLSFLMDLYIEFFILKDPNK